MLLTYYKSLYSYFNASIGLIFDAFIAGRRPETIPTKNGNNKDNNINCISIYGRKDGYPK
jgi:hypothetical protein